jgi:dipeptide/tripeptide permease
MSDSKPKSESGPRLKHEFVGMMFAIAIGEIGLQTAALVQAGPVTHFLPAYSHLIVATVLVAASWVGWSLSPSPGARADVKAVFQWGFLVLLVDVSLVICYFIAVRTVDFNNEKKHIDPSSKLAFWLFVIFGVYLFWDFVTKVITPLSEYRRSNNENHKNRGESSGSLSLKLWFQKYGIRIVPTMICLGVAVSLWRMLTNIDASQMVAADIALLFLILLFRALKDLASASFESDSHPEKTFFRRTRVALFWNIVCICGILLGVSGVKGYCSLCERATRRIEMPTDKSVTPNFRGF